MSESRKRRIARSDTVPLIPEGETLLPRSLSEPMRKAYKRASDLHLKSLVQGNETPTKPYNIGAEPPAKPPRTGTELPTKPRKGGKESVKRTTRQGNEPLPRVEPPQMPSSSNKLGREPRRMICNICGSSVITRVQYQASLRTHAIAFLLCIFVYRLGHRSTHIICPSCHSDIYTVVRCEVMRYKYCIAVGLCCFILWPCVCIPYCTPACLDVTHYCPNCNAVIGTGN